MANLWFQKESMPLFWESQDSPERVLVGQPGWYTIHNPNTVDRGGRTNYSGLGLVMCPPVMEVKEEELFPFKLHGSW